jgi:hypothetical protein
MTHSKFTLILLAIMIFAATLRFTGLNWDQGHHLHPDERFLTMVTDNLRFPTTLTHYFNTSLSTLNPHNVGYNFYVYGTFPLTVTKAAAIILDMDNYGDITIVGRFLSAVLELGIIYLIFLTAKQITQKTKPALLAAFLYAVMWTPIQLAHFYAVDPWLVFFLTLTLYLTLKLLRRPPKSSLVPRASYLLPLLLGASLGLAAASKITALFLTPLIALAALYSLFQSRQKLVTCSLWLGAALAAALTFRLAQPYFFLRPGFFDLTPNPKILANWQELKAWEQPENTPPFGYQWIPTTPYLYPATHLFLWGLGIPIGILTFLTFGYVVLTLIKKVFPSSVIRNPLSIPTSSPWSSGKKWLQTSTIHLPSFLLLLSWVLLIFIYQGGQFAKALRYFYPALPALAILLGTALYFIYKTVRSTPLKSLSLVACILLPFYFSLSLTSIYTRPHSRVQASAWIYQNIPPGSTITSEVWDDGLPLSLNGLDHTRYTTLALPLYDPDSPGKWLKLSQDLAKADYLILSSNRLWRSITALPEKYPVSSIFYQQLLSNQLGFTTVATITSYPCLIPHPSSVISNPSSIIRNPSSTPTNPSPPPISFEQTPYCYLALNSDGAEESFTVYDHPKVIILKNESARDPQVLYQDIFLNQTR